MELAQSIIAILFYYAEPMSIKRLSVVLKYSEQDIQDALLIVRQKLAGTGIMLIQNTDSVTLGTAVEASALIENITKEELSKDLSKSALETLAIILYKGPITRSEIDYIRGVNSTFILRNLLVRGLVEKIENPNDQRSFNYRSTFQLLEYMGIGDISELPDYHDVIKQLGIFTSAKDAEHVEILPTTESAHRDVPTTNATPETITDAEISASAIADAMNDDAMELDMDADMSEEEMAGEGFNDDALRDHSAPQVS